MAWTTPMTFTSGAVLTAAQLNTHLRDNLNETCPAKATTVGRFFTVTGTNQITEWARPAASMSKEGGALRSASTWHDEGGWSHDSGSPTGGVTYGGTSVGLEANSDGIFHAHLSFAFDGNATGSFRGCRLLLNGTTEVASGGTGIASGMTSSRITFYACAPRLSLTSTDSIVAASFHNATSSLAPSSATGALRFVLEMVDPL